MTRRPLIVILGVLMAFAVASPVAATSAFPSRLDLPAGWMPEGITAGAGNTVYVGSLAGGGVWAADVRTGEGHILVPPWGGAATGVEYEKGAHRLWVAGATTGTVRVYDTRTGALLREYTFPGTVFLNDLVVTKDAVYVTDSFEPVAGRHPAGPEWRPARNNRRHDAAADRDRVRARSVQRERHRGEERLARRRRFVHRWPVPRGSADRCGDRHPDGRRERHQR